MMQFKYRAPGFMGGDKAQARALADKILRLNPSEGYISKSTLAGLEKNVAEVEVCYRKAVEADPKSYHALTLLAGFYTQAPHARYEQAVLYARQAAEVDPSRVDAYGILARVLAFEQRWGDLDLILTTAQEKVPDDLLPYYEASNALLETGKDLPRAEKYAKTYLSQEPEGDQLRLRRRAPAFGAYIGKRKAAPLKPARRVSDCTAAQPQLQGRERRLGENLKLRNGNSHDSFFESTAGRVFLILGSSRSAAKQSGRPGIQPHGRAAAGWLDRRVDQSDTSYAGR